MPDFLRADRFDFDLVRAETTPQGYLKIKGAIIAKGDVLEYRNADGSVVRELRDPAVIHRPEVLEGYNGLPLVLGTHPTDALGRLVEVNAANIHKYQVGCISGTPWPDEVDGTPVTRADVLITSPKAIDAAKRGGFRQFSVGYRTGVDNTPGAGYDRRQTSDLGNHLVLCEKARAGSITEFRVDSAGHLLSGASAPADLPIKPTPSPLPPESTRPMPKITHKGITHDVPAELAPVFQDIQTRADTAEADRDKYKGQVDIITKERDDLQKRADTAESDVDVDKLVDERMAIVARARPFLGESYEVKGKSNHELRADAVAAHTKDDAWKSRPEGEVLGAFGVLPKGSAASNPAPPASTPAPSSLNRQYGRGDASNPTQPADVRSAYANRGYGSGRERAARRQSRPQQ